MNKTKIYILANRESLVVRNPSGLECAHISWRSLRRLGASLETRDEFVNALKNWVHSDPFAEVEISREAEDLLAKAVATPPSDD